MLFRSTRSESEPVVAEKALLQGLAPDGGLYVPLEFPAVDPAPLAKIAHPYQLVAERVISPWFASLPTADVTEAIEASASTFDNAAVAPLISVGDLRILELFHGPTLAFKDLALTLLGPLLSMARRRVGMSEELLVIVATSGDTGSAALSGLAGVAGLRVVVLYPAKGVSLVQRLQMTTHDESNVLVLGIDGTFDEAQGMAKYLLSDPDTGLRFARRGYAPSSANSINIGRLVPQIAYFYYAWLALKDAGELVDREEFNVAVPSGNFGNVLSARYAKYMGLPIGEFLVASNRNRVLADFLGTWTYDRNRPFHVTSSPSMDILVSSNLERLVFEATGRDSSRTSSLMADLTARGIYRLEADECRGFADFSGAAIDDAGASAEIRRTYEESGYLLDPHTATACAALRGRDKGAFPWVVAATASPFKFASTVASALGIEPRVDEFATIDELARRTGLRVPPAIDALRGKPEVHRGSHDPVIVPTLIEDWLVASHA
jgi:threonine synthase